MVQSFFDHSFILFAFLYTVFFVCIVSYINFLGVELLKRNNYSESSRDEFESKISILYFLREILGNSVFLGLIIPFLIHNKYSIEVKMSLMFLALILPVASVARCLYCKKRVFVKVTKDFVSFEFSCLFKELRKNTIFFLRYHRLVLSGILM